MQGGWQRATIWVDDRDPIFRRGLLSCITAEGFGVAGESAGLRPAPELGGVDVLVFEATAAGLPPALGLVKTTGVRAVAIVPAVPEHLVYDAVDGGVAALLLRADLTPAALAGALRAVAGGATAFPPGLVSQLLVRAAHSGTGGPHALSTRELAVLRFLSEGDDTREIADALGYSERTVKNIVHDLLMKINCRNRAHAVAVATRQGLI
ncbi:MAG: LuxR C-terminal-related transcriptional regulator [Acidimicrobiales bacterium]